MSTLNNKTIYATTPYIQNQLIYNLPLQVYSEDGTTLTNDIKIQAFKRDDLGLKILVGIELIENTNFSVAINSTANGIIITLFQNILEAEFLEVYRYTNPQSTTEYSGQTQTTTLKASLDTDITNAFNSLQEHEKLLQNVRVETSKYSEIVINQGTSISNIQTDLATIPRTALQLPATPNLGITSTNTQYQIYELKTAIDEARKGITLRTAVRVATITNINTLNVTEIDGITLVLNDRILVKNQINKGENGIYFFNGINALQRTTDADTLSKIAGSQTQAKEGTYENKEFYCIVDNLNGTLGIETVIVEEIFNAIGNNQVELKHLAKQPAGTFIANLLGVLSEPQYATATEVKSFLDINNVDNTSDLNKPVSTATQTALDLKTNQTDFEDLNSYTVTQLLNLQTEIANKQDTLPIGGSNQYLGFDSNQIVLKTLNINLIEGGENIDNTRDVDKPISNPQATLFSKCFQEKPDLETFTIDNTFLDCVTLASGNYYVSSALLTAITDKPTQVQNGSVANLILHNIYLGEVKIGQTQTLIEIANTETFIYTRAIITSPTQSIKNWTRLANNLDITTLNNTIQGLIVGQLQDIYVPQTQFETALNSKEDKLPLGTNLEYFRGDKTTGILSTDAVVEGTNQARLYHSQARVRATTLTGYTALNTVTTATDNVLQALGKKADTITINNAINLKANLNSPTFTGTPTAPTTANTDSSTKIATTEFASKPYYALGTVVEEYIESGIVHQTILEPNGVKKFLLNGQTINQVDAPELFIKKGWSGSKTLQNRSGRVSLQVGGSYTIGATGGSATHTLTIPEMPSHDHNLTTQGGGSGGAGEAYSGGSFKFPLNPATTMTGGNQPHNNMQPYIVSAFYLIGW